jgi:cell pole-organizing protein PopZ
MSQPAKAQEPSMEEILASIRRIIADDDVPKDRPKDAPNPAAVAAKAAAEPALGPVAKNSQDDIDAMLAGFEAELHEPDETPPAESDAEVLELTESMQAKSAFATIDGPPDVVFSEAPEPERSAPPPEEPWPMPDRTLLSPRTTAAVDMAFNSLAHTVLVQNSRTLEDLVKEMLKPMLKTWLDDNLPNMVERLVRAEIERVSRGRG